MERAVAIKKLNKLIGKGFGYRINGRAPTKEEREEAKAELAIAVKEKTALQEKKRARFEAIIAADAEYQSLLAAYNIASKHAEKLFSLTHSSKITVGAMDGMFFVVKADGDSWEEVISKVESRA